MTWLGAHALGEPTLRVAVGNEADVVAVGLLGDREAALGCLGTDLGLGRRRAEGEHAVRQLLTGEDTEHVALVFGPGGCPVQFAVAVGVGHDVRVVSCGHGVEAQVDGLLEQRGELDALVAAHARVRRAPGGVLGDEVVDDVGLESLREIPHVVGDADFVGDALRIHGVFDGAAASRAGTERSRHS
jgi:hypothetical protein